MIVPDLMQICEIMLYSSGFAAARQLAKKMTVLYARSQESLSKQYHYDFGLRALKCQPNTQKKHKCMRLHAV